MFSLGPRSVPFFSMCAFITSVLYWNHCVIPFCRTTTSSWTLICPPTSISSLAPRRVCLAVKTPTLPSPSMFRFASICTRGKFRNGNLLHSCTGPYCLVLSLATFLNLAIIYWYKCYCVPKVRPAVYFNCTGNKVQWGAQSRVTGGSGNSHRRHLCSRQLQQGIVSETVW